jgi:hypothetical protein
MVNALGQLSMALPHVQMLQHAPMMGGMAPHPFIGPVGPQHLRPRMYGAGGGGHFLMHMLAMHGMGPQ